VLGAYTAVQAAKCVDSTTSYGVQLADAIAGTVNRLLRAPDREALDAYGIMHERETVLWHYPFDASPQKDEGLKQLPIQSKLRF
jgi:hypothetical protein